MRKSHTVENINTPSRVCCRRESMSVKSRRETLFPTAFFEVYVDARVREKTFLLFGQRWDNEGASICLV
jgi:hypothetical protein